MWWTVLSAGWLHGGALHIFFNMMWVRQLGPATADIYGAGRMVIIYTIAGVVGFLLSSFAGVSMASVPIGSCAAASLRWARRRRSSGCSARWCITAVAAAAAWSARQAMAYAVVLFVFGLIMPGVDNYAHAGGFIGGYLASMWLDPLKRERMDHFIYAIVCLVATALAVVASLITILPDLIQAARSAS